MDVEAVVQFPEYEDAIRALPAILKICQECPGGDRLLIRTWIDGVETEITFPFLLVDVGSSALAGWLEILTDIANL